MQLCMKLNKRLKSLESKVTELGESEREATAQRDELLGFVVMEVLRKDVPSDGLHMSLPLLQREWAEREEERNMTLQSMQQQHRNYVQAKEQEIRLLMSSLPSSSLPSSSPSSAPPSTTDSHQQQHQQQQQLQHLSVEKEKSKAALAAQEREMEGLRRELHGHVKALEEERDMVVSLHNQLAATKAQQQEQQQQQQQQQEQEQKEKKAKEAAIALSQQEQQQQQQQAPSPLLAQKEKELQDTLVLLHSLQHDLELKNQKLISLEEQLGAVSILLQQKEELPEEERLALSHHHQRQQALTSSLQTSQLALQAALQEKQQLQQQQQQQKAEEWRQQFDEARSALSGKSGLVVRLKEELDKAEQLHASKTAQVAQLEGGEQEMVLEMEVLREVVKEGEGLIAALKRDLEMSKHKAADAESAQARAEAEQQQIKIELEKELWAQRQASLLQHQQNREAHSAELTTLQRDNQKKSSLAQSLLHDKDTQLSLLTQQLTTLQADLTSGSHADHAIMELATKQSLRDTQQRSEVDSFKISFKKLQETLAQKDLECARLSAAHASLTSESVGLRRVQQREGCNLEYLKNVVVDYLSFPPWAASEKNSLERVLATLLAFSLQDRKKIKEGREGGRRGGLASWLLVPPGRPVKDITPVGGVRVGGGREGGREGGRVVPAGATIMTGRLQQQQLRKKQQQEQRGEHLAPLLLASKGVAAVTGGGAGAGGGRKGGPAAGGRTSSSSLEEGGEEGRMDASGGEGNSLESSAGSISLSSSDFESLSGHGTKGGGGREGGRGGREGAGESPTRPRHLGLLSSGESGAEGGGEGGRGGGGDDVPIVSL